MFWNKKGQQEMVGFVLIVVVVMIGLMVFLVFSLRDSPSEENNVEVDNMLAAIMTHTTECAIPVAPYYQDFQDLFKLAYEGVDCSGVNLPALEYLEYILPNILEDLMATEARVSAYQFDYSIADEEELEGVIQIEEGECEGEVIGAQRKIDAGDVDLIIRLRICKGLS